MGRIIKFFMLLSMIGVSCQEKPLSKVMEEQQGDPDSGGISSAERRANGTVILTFRGMVGAATYTVKEERKPFETGGLAKLTRLLANLVSSPDPSKNRLFASVQHVQGKLVYDLESSHIPFGGQFCYFVEASTKKSETVKLGQSRCLLNDQNWAWNGLTDIAIDGSGKAVLSWDRLPVQGSTYEVEVKSSDKDPANAYKKLNTVFDVSNSTDEISDDMFPRCYRVKVAHPLLSERDANTTEKCLTLETWKAERAKSSDISPPSFLGIKSIDVSRNSGILSAAAKSLSLGTLVTVVLSWDEAKDESDPSRRISYEIYRSEQSFGFDFKAPLARTAPGELNFKDTTIAKGATYYYLVRAVDSKGNIDQNLNQKILPLDLQAPDFAGLEASQVRRVGTSVKVVLSWNAANDASPPQSISYEIYRSQSSNSFPSEPVGKVLGVTSFEDATAERGQTYYYKATAEDKEGNRDTNTKELLVNTGETPPTFNGIGSVVLSRSRALIKWDPAQDDETPTSSIFYRVYRRSEDGSFNFKSPLFQTMSGSLQYEDASINPNLSYYFAVRAVDEQGFEDQNTKELSMAANVAPSLNSAPVVIWDKTRKCMRVSWTAAIDDSTSAANFQYKVFRSNTPDVGSFNFNRPLDILENGIRTYLDCEALGQNGYSYIVRAIDSDQAESSNSPVGTIIPNQPAEPGKVTEIAVVNSSAVRLRWNAASDDRSLSANLKYNIYRFVKSSSARVYTSVSRVAQLDSDVREFVDTSGVSATNEYSWLVRVVDEYDLESVNTTDEVSLSANLSPNFLGISSAVLQGIRNINLTWTLATDDRTSQNLIDYKVYVMEVPEGTPTGKDPNFPISNTILDQLFVPANVKQTIQGSVTGVAQTIPDSNKTYIFGVRAFDSQGASDENRKALGIPSNIPPTFAGLSDITELSDGSVRLGWISAVDDRDTAADINYRIYRKASNNASESAADIAIPANLYRTSDPSRTSFVDENVISGANNHYVVRAVDKDQAEDTNTVVKTLTKDVVNPSFLGIKSSSMDGPRITLVWDAAIDNRTSAFKMRYRVYESLSPTLATILTSTPIAELTNGQLSFSTTPATGAKYYYVVRAVDQAGNTDANEVVKFTVDEIPPVFGGLTAGYAITGTSAQIFWTSIPSSDIDEVAIYKSENLTVPLATVKARNDQGVWQNSYLVTGLNLATSYSLIGRARDAYGNEDKNSVAVSLTTLASYPPVFAGLQKAIPAQGVSGLSSIDLEWSPALEATHYRVYRILGASERAEEFDFEYSSCAAKWGSSTLSGCVELEGASLTSYTVTGLSKNSEYSFIVRAVRKDGNVTSAEERNRVMKTASTVAETAPQFAGASSAEPAPGAAGLNTVLVKWGNPARTGVYDGFYVLSKQISGNATAFSIPTDFATDPGLNAQQISDFSVREAYVANLIYNTRYCFVVVTFYSAVDGLRSVPTSDGFKCTVPVAQPPVFAGVKTTVERGAGGLGFSQLKVEWDPAIGSFSQYELSWSLVNDYVSASNTGSFFGPGNTQIISTRNTTKATLSNLQGNKTFYIRARALFTLNSPAISLSSGADAVAQAVTSPLAPAGDGILTARQVTNDQIKITWAAPSNGGLYDRYYVFRSEGVSAESEMITQLSSDLSKSPPYRTEPFVTVLSTSGDNFSKTFFEDTGVVANTKYCYTVKAAFSSIQGFVGSANSLLKCVEVQINPPTFAGIVSLKTPTSAQGFTSLVAAWTPATGNFTSYQYAVGLSPDEASTWVNIPGGIALNTYTINNLQPNETYFVKIRAVYQSGGMEFPSGQDAVQSALTTPKQPQHNGLDPISFLQDTGEIKLTWTAPQTPADVGGLYDRYLLWKWVGGTGTDIMTEITSLLEDQTSPGIISAAEVGSNANHVKEYASNLSYIDFLGDAKLPENVQTCFLIRAAFRLNNLFVMSQNQSVRCVTPQASAPQFGGIANLLNIPFAVNGFSQLKATWVPATGSFTRYEVALSLTQNTSTWVPRAFTGSNINVSEATMSNTDVDTQLPTTKLVSHKTYFGRVRAIYVGSGGTIYSAGEATEMSMRVEPNRPFDDGIRAIDSSKVPGKASQAKLTIKGDAGGFWDRVVIFRTINSDQSAARADVIAKSSAKADMSAFVGTPLGFKLRPSSASTQDIVYEDSTMELGKWNCYVARSAYQQQSDFLTSDTAQQPSCVQPVFNPISFAGVSSEGSEVCQAQDPSDPEPCEITARWEGTGNSRIRLKLDAVPQGDLDFYDVYMGTSPNASELLFNKMGNPRTPFQTIWIGDTEADTNPNDAYLEIGGTKDLHILGGSYYFLVRARCIGCDFADTNEKVSNQVVAQRPWLVSSFNFDVSGIADTFAADKVTSGVFEDPQGGNVYEQQSLGELNLEAVDDYARATTPSNFAPKPGTTLAIKFNLMQSSDRQNVEGSALFAADSATRMAYWDNSPTATFREGSLFGLGGAVSVFDERTQKCMWLGGYAGSARDMGDLPSRDWSYHWYHNRLTNAMRLQTFDGFNFSEEYPRGATPLPRSMPVVAFDPVRKTTLLFGGLNQSNPQKIAADTWEFDGKVWERVDEGSQLDQTLDTELGRYGGNVMASDPFSGEMVMVGGRYTNPCGSNSDPTQGRVKLMTSPCPDNVTITNKVRNKAMAAFVYDTVAKKRKWKDKIALPGAFPDGYPAALVSIPSGPNQGLYYFSSRMQYWEAFQNNNVWKYDGNSWSELAGTAIPDNAAYSALYAFYEDQSGRIFITMARGNNAEAKRVWEFNPAASGSAVWTKRYNADAPQTLSGMPCYDPIRKQLIDYGGTIFTGTPNQSMSQKIRTPQDIYLFSPISRTWKLAPVEFDNPNQSPVFSTYPKLGGVVAHGGLGYSANLSWSEYTNAGTTWLFISGLWKRLWNQDSAKKWFVWGDIGSTPDLSYTKGTLDSSIPGSELVYVLGKSGPYDTSALNGRGRPSTLREYDGTGWVAKSVKSDDIVAPDDKCPNRAVWASPYNLPANDAVTRWHVDAPWGQSYRSINTPWGVLVKGAPWQFYGPYEATTTTPNCSGGLAWRYADTSFSFIRKESGEYVAREIKPSDRAVPSDPFKFCGTVGQSPENPDLDPKFKRWPPHMFWDETERQIVLYGYDETNVTYFTKNVQALRMKNESNSAIRCLEVVNLTSPFPNSNWTTLYTHNQNHAVSEFDSVRRKALVFSTHWTTNSAGIHYANTNGFVWEFDLPNKMWTPRLLPTEYTRWTALSGGPLHNIANIPGKPSEFLISPRRELQDTQRHHAENYILKVTNTEITMKPVLPRFGVTMGADKKSAYISVPGDAGEADGIVNGIQQTSGRRKISNDLTGNHTLFLVFGTNNTYSVYMDGSANPLVSNVPWAGENTGIYLSEFILGARYGVFARYSDVSLRGFTGIGNVKSRFDWIKVFDKPLTTTEIDYWANTYVE